MFGDKKKAVAAILGPRGDEVKAPEADSGDESLKAIAEEAIEACHAKDAQGFVDAVRALFSAFDASPHVEGEHLND